MRMQPQQELTNSGLNRPDVSHFFHSDTSTLTYVVACGDTGHCAIIDPVLDFDYASGSLTTESVDALIEHIESRALTVDLILETHVHADHLTAAPHLQQHLGGQRHRRHDPHGSEHVCRNFRRKRGFSSRRQSVV